MTEIYKIMITKLAKLTGNGDYTVRCDKVSGIIDLDKEIKSNQNALIIIKAVDNVDKEEWESSSVSWDNRPLETEAKEEVVSWLSNYLDFILSKKNVPRFESILPVCCVCKKIRDDEGKCTGEGDWLSIEEFIHTKADIAVTSTYCTECAGKVKKEIERFE